MESIWVTDPHHAPWFEDEFPAGAWSFSNGTSWSYKFRRLHSEPAQPKSAAWRRLQSADDGARTTDVMVCESRRSQNRQTNLGEMNDEHGSWDHRAIGRESAQGGRRSNHANWRLGDIRRPGAGRLEIPARLIRMDGRQCRELAFCVYGGAVKWDGFGVCTGSESARES